MVEGAVAEAVGLAEDEEGLGLAVDEMTGLLEVMGAEEARVDGVMMEDRIDELVMLDEAGRGEVEDEARTDDEEAGLEAEVEEVMGLAPDALIVSGVQ